MSVDVACRRECRCKTRPQDESPLTDQRGRYSADKGDGRVAPPTEGLAGGGCGRGGGGEVRVGRPEGERRLYMV
jgi:hypothetical protein